MTRSLFNIFLWKFNERDRYNQRENSQWLRENSLLTKNIVYLAYPFCFTILVYKISRSVHNED